MPNVVLRWSMKKMVTMITRILNNKFDCFIVIEGNRGLGKSTLAIHLARKVSKRFKNMGLKDYRFHWYHSLIYSKKQTKQFWHRWRSTGIADEMINVTFNRDFYDSEQKDIIKMINMNRDHRNLFIACVPSFKNLDSQIKNLCKIRITIARRGVAVIQTPNRTIYAKDRWDEKINEKIERSWIEKGVKNPHYAKLTTFRGLLTFPALTKKQEEKYQEIKDKKRNLIAREEMGIENEDDQKDDPYENAINMLREGKVRNGTQLDGYAQAHGLKPNSFKSQLRRKLKDKGYDHIVGNYYWEKKAKQKESGSI